MNSSLSAVSSALRDCRHCSEGERTGGCSRPALRPSPALQLRNPASARASPVPGTWTAPPLPAAPPGPTAHTRAAGAPSSSASAVPPPLSPCARAPPRPASQALDALAFPLFSLQQAKLAGPGRFLLGKSRAPVTRGPWQPRYHLSTGHTAAASPVSAPGPAAPTPLRRRRSPPPGAPC